MGKKYEITGRGRSLFLMICIILLVFFAKGASCASALSQGVALEVLAALPSLEGLPQALFEALPANHFLVRLSEGDFAAQRARMKASALEVIEYIPENTYLVESAVPVDEFRKTEAYGMTVFDYLPLFKIEPLLLSSLVSKGKRGEGDEVKLLVMLFEDGRKEELLRDAGEVPGVRHASEPHPDPSRFVLISSRASLEKLLVMLSSRDEVYRIEKFRDKYVMNNEASWINQSGVLDERPVWDHGITGAGQKVAIADTGLDIDHCFYHDPFHELPLFVGDMIDPNQRKVVGYYVWTPKGNDWDKQGHGTHTAGTAAGDNHETIGGYDTDDGLAYGAKLIFQDLGWGNTRTLKGTPSNLELLFSQAFEAGARVHSNSWGNEENVYSAHARDVDNFLFKNPDMVIVFSAGNDGPATGTLGEPATAKNCISVGASHKGIYTSTGVASFSSRGPTSDGRLKPDLVAPGVYINSARNDGNIKSFNCNKIANSGTSMSAPVVAGLAALVRQYYADGFYPTGKAAEYTRFNPSGALVKATLINSCGKILGDDSIPPNNDIGWGSPVLDEALYFEGDRRKLQIFDITDGIEDGETHSYRIANASSEIPLKITLTWYDPMGSSSASRKLVNNLDLTLTSPDGTPYAGNNFSDGYTIPGRNPDVLNNVEGILIEAPQAGSFEITVTGAAVPAGPQPYALVITGDLIGRGGDLSFDKVAYQCVDTATVRLLDADLSGVGTFDVTIKSEVAGAEMILTLYELQEGTGIFANSVDISTDPESGAELLVSELDTLSVTYNDADDGTGLHDVEVKATAGVDCIPPVIKGVNIRDAGYDYITIEWETDEPTRGEVVYALKSGGPEMTAEVRAYTINHALRLDGLERCSDYKVEIAAEDRSGNRSLDDNGGAWYEFRTLDRLLVHAGEELFAEGLWGVTSKYSHDGGEAWASGYSSNQCDRLYTPYFYISPVEPTYLSFWTIYDFEAGYDGGTVEVAADFSGKWEIIEPVLVGYPMTSRDDTTSCIGGSVPCFSGKSMEEWKRYTVDLAEYAGRAVALSFLFGSDPAVAGEGWFLDEITIFRNASCLSIDNPTGIPQVQCKTGENRYQPGDYLEGFLYYDNPTGDEVSVDVYCAILRGKAIYFYNGTEFVPNAEPFTKLLPPGKTIGESIFIIPILDVGLRGDYIFAACIAMPGTQELYGDVWAYPFSIK